MRQISLPLLDRGPPPGVAENSLGISSAREKVWKAHIKRSVVNSCYFLRECKIRSSHIPVEIRANWSDSSRLFVKKPKISKKFNKSNGLCSKSTKLWSGNSLFYSLLFPTEICNKICHFLNHNFLF